MEFLSKAVNLRKEYTDILLNATVNNIALVEVKSKVSRSTIYNYLKGDVKDLVVAENIINAINKINNEID